MSYAAGWQTISLINAVTSKFYCIILQREIVEYSSMNNFNEQKKLIYNGKRINESPRGEESRMVARYAEKRAKYLADGDYEALQSIPKNASPVRLHNRCKITGRPKGYMRQFGISRIQFREMASKGLIPGVKKASW